MNPGRGCGGWEGFAPVTGNLSFVALFLFLLVFVVGFCFVFVFCFLFLFFEPGSLCVALAVLELTL